MILMPPAALRLTSPPLPTDGRELVTSSLRHAADLLDGQGAEPARASDYRHAADAIDRLNGNLRTTAEAGSIADIPGVGCPVATAVAELLATGRWGFLERLTGASDAEALFCAIPGIGPSLAHRIQEVLRIDSLQGLAAAARDGRLVRMAGFGPRRAAAVSSLFAGWPWHLWPRVPHVSEEPETALLVCVDREFRDKATRGILPRIPPRHFEPDVGTWISVLHTVRAPWHCTALWSNTSPDQRRGQTGDWVAVYFHRSGLAAGRRTIVTESLGAGGCQRVVCCREIQAARLASVGQQDR